MCYDKVIATNNVLNVSLQITHSHTPTHTMLILLHTFLDENVEGALLMVIFEKQI